MEKRFRNNRGLIIKMDVQAHRDLHHELFYGPPKPTRSQMHELVDILDSTPREQRLGTWGIEAAIQYFYEQAETHTSPRIAGRSERIGNHLTKQLGFIAVEGIHEQAA
jgi:hypothetical protein